MYLISLYFDEESNKILQRYIDKIATITGNTFMTCNHVPPHMTVLSVETKNVEHLKNVFVKECNGNTIHQNKVYIASLGQMLPYVMNVMPVLNDYLQDMITTLYDAIMKCDEISDDSKVSVSKYYKPGNWMPHITIGKTLSKEQMIKAFEVMQNSFQPFDANVVEIGLARTNPHEDIVRVRLGK